MVAIFILLWGFENFKGDYQTIHSGKDCQWCHRALGEMEIYGHYWVMENKCCNIQSCALFYSTSKWEVYDGNGVSIKNWVFVVVNELPHSWPLGSWKEIMSDLIPWSPCVFVLHFRNNRIESLIIKCVIIIVLLFELFSVHFVNMLRF